MPFSESVKTQALVNSARHCCVCHKKGINVEVHHIVQECDSNDNTIENAIVLCFDCHADAGHYNTKHPRGNKYSPSELRKHRDQLWDLVKTGKIATIEKDKEINYLELLRKGFDRPLFNTRFKNEGRMEDFEKAIQDTILLINTGRLRTRDNADLENLGYGKSDINDKHLREEMEVIVEKLKNVLIMVNKGLTEGKLRKCHDYCYCGDEKYIRKIDQMRMDIITALNSILGKYSLHPLSINFH